jgi:aminopeptidase N
MKRRPAIAWLGMAAVSLPGFASDFQPGHYLPGGAEQSVRERQIDIEGIAADLEIDLEKQALTGKLAVEFAPLRAGLAVVEFDAADLEIHAVEELLDDNNTSSLEFEVRKRKLLVSLARIPETDEPVTLRIDYSAKPRTGLYFHKAGPKGAAQAWSYGEGGLHYGWLPLYNDVNDRFTSEMRITVDEDYTALSNGTLVNSMHTDDGRRTWYWRQNEPVANYLLALKVGRFVEMPLGTARAGGRDIPVNIWTEPGREQDAAYTFRNAPDIIEFFSARFGHPYRWDKYDSVTLREFDWSMETATMTGTHEGAPRKPQDPVDDLPDFELAYPMGSYEETIAHEAAHHWFGNLVTPRSLNAIWLSESFATFAEALWTRQSLGEDDFTYRRWRHLNFYLQRVNESGMVRPLEFNRFDNPTAIYDYRTIYVKGALVLHMLAHFVGEDAFFKAIAEYLAQHAFGEVQTEDFRRAVEDATGRDLGWFFADWVQGGGGRPAISVTSSWSPHRKAVDMSISQVHAMLPFEDTFRLPVQIELMFPDGNIVHDVILDNASVNLSLPADQPPAAIVFDKGNWLVAEVEYSRPLAQALYQLEHADLAGALAATRELAVRFERRPAAIRALIGLLADDTAHWGLRQAAATSLGEMGGDPGADALATAAGDADRRIRRAAAIALGAAAPPEGPAVLRRLVSEDPAEDVAAAASIALGRMQAEGAADFLRNQLNRESRWWNARQHGAVTGLAYIADPKDARVFERYSSLDYDTYLRSAALWGWFEAAPHDPRLAQGLRTAAWDTAYDLRSVAIELLGQLHRAEDIPFLEDIAARDADPNMVVYALAAADEIRSFTQSGSD